MPRTANKLPVSYPALLKDIKSRIRSSQIKAALSVNRELIELYWHIGRSIVMRQRKEGWGKSIVEKLSSDIKKEFPNITGFSAQNIWHMRAFYTAWAEQLTNLQQPVGDLGSENPLQVVGDIP